MTRTLTPCAEAARDMRRSLKARGIGSDAVSVRSNNFSMGSSLDVVVKRPGVDVDMVREIAAKYERISRCEITGEILGGGNRYLHVGFCPSAVRACVAAASSEIRDAFEKAKNDPGRMVPVVAGLRAFFDGESLIVQVRQGEGWSNGRSVWPEYSALANTVGHFLMGGSA